MLQRLSALIVSDLDDDAILFVEELRRSGFDVSFRRVAYADAMRAALDTPKLDLVLSAFRLSDFSAAEALALVRELDAHLPFIVVSSHMSDAEMIPLLQAGAQDCLSREYLQRLGWIVKRELTEGESRQSRRSLEIALPESEERVHKVMAGARDAKILFDSSGRVLLWNAAANIMFGHSEEEAVGSFVWDLVNFQDPEKKIDFMALCSKLSLGESSELLNREIELVAVRRGSSFFPVEVLFTGIRNKTGWNMLAVIRDISWRRESLEEALQAIAATTELRDPYTAGHQQRVAELARSVALEMELPMELAHSIHLAGIVHDVGKTIVPSEMLCKPTKLTKLEFDLIKTHSQAGYEILKGVNFPWPIAKMVLQHHERLDGSGYPQGLKGDEILLEAKILAVADVVEAMSSHRPYRPSLGIDAALEEVIRGRGLQYDSQAVDACVRLFREKQFVFPKPCIIELPVPTNKSS